MSLRFVLAAIYEVLSENLTDEGRYALDGRLGLNDNEEPGEIPDDPRLGPDVPVAREDPAAMAALAAFGDSTYE